MDILLLMIMFIAEMINYIFAYKFFYKIKPNIWYPMPIFWGIYILIILLNRDGNLPLTLLLHIMTAVTFLLMNRRNNILKALFIFFGVSCVSSFAGYFLSLFEDRLNGISYIGYLCDVAEQVITLLILCFAPLIKRVISKDKNRERILYYKNVFAGMLITAALLLACSLGSLSVLQEYTKNTRDKWILSIMGMLSYLAIAIVVLLIVSIKGMNQRLQELLNAEEQLRGMQSRYYDSIKSKVEETAKYRHDISNHIMVLKQMVYRKDLDRLNEYLQEMETGLTNIKKMTVTTGNELLDIIVNYFKLRMEDSVNVMVRGRLVTKLSINEYDLCTIFANLFENIADEIRRNPAECTKVELEICEGNEYIQFILRNNKKESAVHIKEEYRFTSKEDKENHGFGLINVREAVNRNDGLLEITELPQEYIVKLTFSLIDNRSRS